MTETTEYELAAGVSKYIGSEVRLEDGDTVEIEPGTAEQINQDRENPVVVPVDGGASATDGSATAETDDGGDGGDA